MVQVQLSTFRCFAGCKVKADVVFVLDTSGSIDDAEWAKMVKFVKESVANFNIGNDGIRVGLIQYSKTNEVVLQLKDGTTKGAVESALDGINRLKSGTYTAAAIQSMANSMFSSPNGDRLGVVNIGIVVTDAKSANTPATVAAANDARSKGIALFAVGVGTNLDKEELKGIANDPDQKYMIKADTFDALSQAVGGLREGLCVSYSKSSSTNHSLKYTSQNELIIECPI